MQRRRASRFTPSTKKRGADPQVSAQQTQRAKDLKEQRLEQGLEESMAGSDPVSVSKPVSSNADTNKSH
jgi:hypothetical protein